MNHLLAFSLCLAGCGALAMATRRQQRDIMGRSLRLTTTYLLRAFGACALLAALGLLVTSQGWGLGLVMFSGHSSIIAAVVYCALVAYGRIQSRLLRDRRG